MEHGSMHQHRRDARQGKPSEGPVELQFVVSTTDEKPDPELRKFIRSHVMKGKNKGKILKKRNPIREQDDVPSASGSLPTASTIVTGNRIFDDVQSAQIPRKFGSDFCSVRFADSVEPKTVEVVIQFSLIAKKVMFALEPCMHFDWRAEMWLLPLSMDPVFLHTMIFTSQYYFNSVLAGRKFHSSHYLKALTALRERMEHDGDQDKLSFNTMASVMGLAGQAYMMGDVKTARNHLEGLYRIVELRGGIEIFQGNPKLLVEILRCDLGMALYSGSHPVFLEDFASSQPLPDLTPLRSLQEFVEMDATIFSSVKSYELSRMWMFMSEFCCLIDFAAESSTLLTVDIFLGCITSIMYRLIKMRCRQDTVDEAVRLGILALSSGLFLQWKNLGISYPYLASCYKDCLTRLNSTRTPHNLMIWLLVAGAVSLWDISDEAWLAVSLQARVALVRVDRWDTMRTLLKSFMWVDLVHDKAGQRVFDFVLTGRDSPSRGLLR